MRKKIRYVVLLLLCFLILICLPNEKKAPQETEGESPVVHNMNILLNLFGIKEEKPATIHLEHKTGEERIRIVIKNNGYSSIYHEEIEIEDSKGNHWRFCNAKAEQEKNICLIGEEENRFIVTTLDRNQTFGGFRGDLYLYAEEDGYVLVNELPLEAYLYGVVPGEMPASYPLEALKAQAVCARSYAYDKLLHPRYERYTAHLDDSTSFQVYGTGAERDSTNEAVRITEGQVLLQGETEVLETWYYSTSMGNGREYLLKENRLEDRGSWQGYLQDLTEEEAFQAVICTVDEQDLENQEKLYRWTVECFDKDICEKLYDKLKQLPSIQGDALERFQYINNLEVTKRGQGGVVEEITIVTEKGSYSVEGESNCRKLLCLESAEIRDQYGTLWEGMELLPSGFFVIETSTNNENVIGYKLCGGGFGHGRGMSQNGAKGLALRGYSYEEILMFFYGEDGDL